jgi:DNA-binding transcriptional LysR family regulator
MEICVSIMEINSLNYFLAVAKRENIHRASEDIGISPASLSKAITKIENELKVKLFKRVGRNIQLTEEGLFLKKRGHQLVGLENTIKMEILGQETAFKVSIGASEILLSSFGVDIATSLHNSYPRATLNLRVETTQSLFSKVRDGEIDLGITTYDVPREFDKKTLSLIEFHTFISKFHPLFTKAKKGPLYINEILTHSFVVPDTNILGKIKNSDSSDGWRDDKFKRKIAYTSSSLKTIESLVFSGKAIAYLPSYLGEQLPFLKIDIKDCPDYCKQRVTLFAINKERSGHIQNLF